MREAVVLVNGYIVYLDTITDSSVYDPQNTEIIFSSRTGRVISFTKNSETYMAIYNTTPPYLFKNYVKALDFWNTSNPTVSNDNEINWGNSSLESNVFKVKNILGGWDILNQYGQGVDIGKGVEEGTEVIMVSEKIFHYGTAVSMRINKKTFSFQNRNLNDNENFYEGINFFNGEMTVEFPINTNFKDPLNADFDYIERYPLSVSNKKFKNFITGEFYFTSLNQQILDEIIFLFVKILDYNPPFYNYLVSQSFKVVFDKHFEIINKFDSVLYPNTNGVQTFFYKYYTERYFNILRIRLIEFYHWANSFNDFSSNNIDVLVRIISLFDSYELSQLSYDVKVELLDKLLKENLWLSGRWNPLYSGTNLTEEEVVVKIISSIAREDSNGNLNYLEIDMFVDKLNSIYSADKTLYQILYERVNDHVFFDDEGHGAKGRMVKAIYNLWQFSKYNPYHESSSIAASALSFFTYTPYNCRWREYDPSITFPWPDETAAPMIINYESERVLLWYIDNFKFEFYNNKILAKEEVKNYGLQPYGVYNYFQPVSIKSVSGNDTIIRMPVLNMPLEGNPNPNDYIKNCIPAFYLMYVDEVGDRSDAKQTIGTAIDVALTFSGIGGVITNLRHFKNLSLIRKLGVGLTLAEKQLLWKGISGLASGFEAFFGAASFFHGLASGGCAVYYDPNNTPPQSGSSNYDEYQRCLAIDNWLFTLEMLSLSGDLLARRALRRASANLKVHLDSSIPIEHRNVIDELADLDGLLNSFMLNLQQTHPTVYSKVNAFTDTDKKFAFMFDFENNANKLQELANDIDLIDAWQEIGHLLSHRKNIKFLKGYNFIVNSPSNNRVRIHIFQGHHNASGTSVSGWHHIFGNNNANSYGQINNIIGTPDALGYYNANVSIKNQNGVFIQKTANGGVNSMFRRDWNESELLENFALAYTNKQYSGVNNQFIGEMSDGKTITICIGLGNNNIDYTTPIKTLWPNN